MVVHSKGGIPPLMSISLPVSSSSQWKMRRNRSRGRMFYSSARGQGQSSSSASGLSTAGTSVGIGTPSTSKPMMPSASTSPREETTGSSSSQKEPMLGETGQASQEQPGPSAGQMSQEQPPSGKMSIDLIRGEIHLKPKPAVLPEQGSASVQQNSNEMPIPHGNSQPVSPKEKSQEIGRRPAEKNREGSRWSPPQLPAANSRGDFQGGLLQLPPPPNVTFPGNLQLQPSGFPREFQPQENLPRAFQQQSYALQGFIPPELNFQPLPVLHPWNPTPPPISFDNQAWMPPPPGTDFAFLSATQTHNQFQSFTSQPAPFAPFNGNCFGYQVGGTMAAYVQGPDIYYGPENPVGSSTGNGMELVPAMESATIKTAAFPLGVDAKKDRKPKGCSFCIANGETRQFRSSHFVRNWDGTVSCPILRLYICPICHATGDQAHTIKYCPRNQGMVMSAYTSSTRARAVGGRAEKGKPKRNSRGVVGTYWYSWP